jgi:hypothetical protein
VKLGDRVTTLAVEGDVDAAVATRLLQVVGLEPGPVHGFRGKNWLDRQIRGYNSAARYADWLVLRDLNGDAACAPELTSRLLPRPAKGMIFRIAVRAVEAWLLADAVNLARFLVVTHSAIPRNVERLTSPKRAMVKVAARSRSRAVREDMVPPKEYSSEIGPAYTSRLIEFANSSWDPRIASGESASLHRCLTALKRHRS